MEQIRSDNMSYLNEDRRKDAERNDPARLVDLLSNSLKLCKYILTTPTDSAEFYREFIDLMGGSVCFDSFDSLHQVSFAVPYINKDVFASKEEENKGKRTYDWSNKTILIAEDEETNFLYLKAVLSRTGIKILHAKTGKEAVEIASSNEAIDLILMDIKMPVMDGLEATMAIKTMNKAMKVIAQTAYTMEEERKNYFLAGCIDYLAKPIRREVLLDTILKYL
jgi:two-component system cell cycle response regulator DivK